MNFEWTSRHGMRRSLAFHSRQSGKLPPDCKQTLCQPRLVIGGEFRPEREIIKQKPHNVENAHSE